MQGMEHLEDVLPRVAKAHQELKFAKLMLEQTAFHLQEWPLRQSTRHALSWMRKRRKTTRKEKRGKTTYQKKNPAGAISTKICHSNVWIQARQEAALIFLNHAESITITFLKQIIQSKETKGFQIDRWFHFHGTKSKPWSWGNPAAHWRWSGNQVMITCLQMIA